MPDRASPLSAGLRKGFMHEPTLLPSTCFATFLYKPLQSCCVPATTTLLVLVVFNRPLQSCCVPATTTIPVLVVCNRHLQSFCVLEPLWVGSFVEIQCKLPSLLFWTMHYKPFFAVLNTILLIRHVLFWSMWGWRILVPHIHFVSRPPKRFQLSVFFK